MKLNLFVCLLFSMTLVSCTSSNKNLKTDLEIAMKEFDDENYSVAMPIFENYCQKNERASCTRVGSILISKDKTKEAQFYFAKSCSLGDSWGCLQLGQTHFVEKNYQVAAPFFEKSCVEYKGSCLYLGTIELLRGKEREARSRFKTLCESGTQSACFYIGYIELKSKNFLGAHSYFNKGCSLGDSRSCLYLPDLEYLVGDKKRAVQLAEIDCANGFSVRGCRIVEILVKLKSQPALSKAWKGECQKGNGASCYWLGLQQSLDRKTYDLSLKSWNRACELGDGFGCVELGNFSTPTQKFSNSEFLTQFYTEACSKGANSACTILGEDTLPVSKKYSYIEALQRGCDLKDGRACSLLASKDWHKNQKAQALKGYSTACKYGDLGGCYWLASLSENSEEVKISKLKEVCQKGYAKACGNLGDLFWKKEEFVQAKEYYQKACGTYDPSACKWELKSQEKLDPNFDLSEKLMLLCKKGLVSACADSGSGFADRQELNKAKAAYSIGCNNFDAFSCAMLGYYNYKDSQSHPETIRLFRKACDLGSGYGCAFLEDLKIIVN